MSDHDNDELVAGFEPEGGTLSEEEMNRREEQFNKRVRRQIAIMMSPKKFNAKKRAEAAAMLGELGEPTAIPYLVKVYRNEKDKRLKQAAEESLGMLKALGEAMDDPDPEIRGLAFEYVQNIVLKGKLGKKANPSAGTLRRLTLILMLLAIVIFVAALLIPERPIDPTLVSLEDQLTMTAAVITPSATATSSDPVVLLERFRDAYASLDADSRVLQAQLLTITRQQPQDCTLTFSPSAQYEVPAVLADRAGFNDAAAAYNAAESAIAAIRARFTQSCSTGQAIPRAEALDLTTQLVEAQRQLTTIAPILVSIGISVPPTATAIAVATNTPEPTPTPSPTATPNTTLLNSQILNMETIINAMNGPRGAHTLLVGYWRDAQAGSSSGCLQMPPPPIPADVIIADATALPDSYVERAELQAAATALNTALGITRNSYIAFESGCNTNTLGQLVGSQVPAVEAAQAGYEDAQNKLNALKQKIGR